MARKKAAEGQADVGNTGGADGGQGQEKVTKADAVRAALAEGIETPDEGIAFIKSRYGIDMGKAMFSSYKSQQKAKAGQSGVHRQGVRKGGRPRKAPETPASAATGVDVGIVADLAAVKRLVERMGAGQVREMIALFE